MNPLAGRLDVLGLRLVEQVSPVAFRAICDFSGVPSRFEFKQPDEYLMLARALRLVAVDTADPRLDVALQLGAETVGAGETRHQAVKMARRGGEVLARPAR